MQVYTFKGVYFFALQRQSTLKLIAWTLKSTP